MKKLGKVLLLVLVGIGLFGFSLPGFAHGYVTQPGSRAYFGTAA
ncbi:MAG: chitin-binding protein, partial [Enterococcus thailandicus]|nr:chitin-binding protein [Enterococcus thailandicus]